MGFGADLPAWRHCMSDAARALGELVEGMPAMVIDTLRKQLRRIEALTQDRNG
jgi:transposase